MSWRASQEPLQRLLKQSVVVENRGGVGGSVGMAEVARVAAYGTTLGVATLFTHSVNPAVFGKPPYRPIKDFVGVRSCGSAWHHGVQSQGAGAALNHELMAYLKAHSGQVSCATLGNGTNGHIWGEIFKSVTGQWCISLTVTQHLLSAKFWRAKWRCATIE